MGKLSLLLITAHHQQGGNSSAHSSITRAPSRQLQQQLIDGQARPAACSDAPPAAGEQEQQQRPQLRQGGCEGQTIVALANLQLHIVGDRQQAAPETGEIPHGAHRKGNPHKGETGRRISPRQRQGAGRIPNDAVKERPMVTQAAEASPSPTVSTSQLPCMG